MSYNLYKIRKNLEHMITALDNVEHSRMPLSHFENIFEGGAENVRDLIFAEHFNKKKEVKDE